MVVTKEQLQFLLSEEVIFKGACTDLSFSVIGSRTYEECWLGKMPNPRKEEKDLYWLALGTDGTNAHYYDTVKEMLTAKVFEGKSLLDLVSRICWTSIDGEPFDAMIRYYLQIDQ